MRYLLIVLALGVQNPNPLPGHGPWANQPGVKCWRNETLDPAPKNRAGVTKLIHCDCQLRCDEHGNQVEGGDCQTRCGPRNNRGENLQCLCHTDESCH